MVAVGFPVAAACSAACRCHARGRFNAIPARGRPQLFQFDLACPPQAAPNGLRSLGPGVCPAFRPGISSRPGRKALSLESTTRMGDSRPAGGPWAARASLEDLEDPDELTTPGKLPAPLAEGFADAHEHPGHAASPESSSTRSRPRSRAPGRQPSSIFTLPWSTMSLANVVTMASPSWPADSASSNIRANDAAQVSRQYSSAFCSGGLL